MKPFFVVVGVVVSFFYGGGRAVSRRCDRRRRSSVIDGNCHCLACRLLGTVDRCERSRSPERHVRPRPQSNNRRGAPSTTIPPRRSGGIRSDGRAERVAAESPCFVFFFTAHCFKPTRRRLSTPRGWFFFGHFLLSALLRHGLPLFYKGSLHRCALHNEIVMRNYRCNGKFSH